MKLPKDKSAAPKAVDLTSHSDTDQRPHAGSTELRLPHERDESFDSQTSEPREVMKQAKKDIENGLEDTDIGPVLDRVYKKKFRTNEDHASNEKKT